MTDLIKVTPVENLFFTLNNADPNRPYYHRVVYQCGRSIFIQLRLEEALDELQTLVRKEIEMPLKADFTSVLDAYYNQKFLFSSKAFCKIGDPLEPILVTRYELGRRLQNITQWILDYCSEISSDVRFHAIQQVQM